MNITAMRSKHVGPGLAIEEAIMDDLNVRFQEAESNDDRETMEIVKNEYAHDISASIRAIEELLTLLRRNSLLRNARKDDVKEGINLTYAEKLKGRKLEVFCVSNLAYFEHRHTGHPQAVEDSGIPELRKFCHAINARAQKAESENFLHNKLPALLDSTKLWMRKVTEGVQDQVQTNQGRAKVENIMEEALAKVQMDLLNDCTTLTEEGCQAHRTAIQRIPIRYPGASSELHRYGQGRTGEKVWLTLR